HYGRPASGRHAVQVEIDRSLYMNERLVEPHEHFAEFKALLDTIIPQLADIGRSERARPLAAE
ncbi:MAG: N-formylglutamate amidohydrolase, partial [Pseudomonadota bacterium]